MPPMFSTRPFASTRSVPAADEASSVSTSWNFTDELPQLRTSTFMRPLYPPTSSRPDAGRRSPSPDYGLAA